MKRLQDTKALIATALLAAFTCVATMVIQFPTPAMGYIHPGDSLVLLSGVILGPALGGLAAGLGSMMADLLSGYAVYAIPTLVIKGLTAVIVGSLFRVLRKKTSLNQYTCFLIGGFFAECNVIFGYFLNDILKLMILGGFFTPENMAAGITNASLGIPTNILQGLVGIVLGTALFPILCKVPDIRIWIHSR